MADTAKKKAKKQAESLSSNGQPNSRLKKLLNLINESTQWSAEEKSTAEQAVKDTEKELADKNHEIEIEAALEKVRAIALSMNHTSDMPEVCRTISDQLENLKVKNIRNVQTAIINESKGTYFNYEYYAKHHKIFITEVDYSHPISMGFINQMLKGPGEFFSRTLERKELKDWYEYQKTTNQFADQYLESAESLTYYWYSLGPVALGISTYSPLSDEEMDLFKRFRNVFELAYRRFLDIEKAIAQAREAQIEAALERVRASALAMLKSNDVNDAVVVMFETLEKLEPGMLRCGVGIIREETRTADVWATSSTDHGTILKVTGDESVDVHPLLQSAFDAWKNQHDFYAELKGEDLIRYYKALEKTNFRLQEAQSIIEKAEAQLSSHPLQQYYYVAPFEAGNLFAFRETPFPDEAKKIIRRFASVFNLTYKRFLDLLKAEEQTREAQIEASLERVRASALAMHESSDLKKAAGSLFTELNKLGINPIRSGFVLLTRNSRRAKLYPATSFDQENTLSFNGEFEFVGHPIYEKQYDSWQKGEDYFPVLEGEVLKSYYRILSEKLSVPYENFPTNVNQFGCFLPFSEGFLFTWSTEQYSEAVITILNRFKVILNLTITRFLDLQKAEAQTRESRIQLALERVRARTMAMQKSDELSETAQVLFQQFNDLGANPIQITIGIYNEEENVIEFRSTDPFGTGAKVDYAVKGSLEEPTLLKKIYADWKEGKKSTVIALEGKELSEWVKYRINISGVPDDRDYSDKRRVVYVGFFSKGVLSVSSIDDPSRESVQLLERFAGVFDLTYTRFLDLKQAEAQAREAIIETALEKVRSRSLAMHSSDEIKDVVVTVMKKMNELNIEMNGGVSLVTFIEGSQDLLHWYVNPGHVDEPQTMLLPYFDNLVFNDFVEARKAAQEILPVVYSFEEKNNYFEYAFEHSDFKIAPEELKKWIFEQPYFGYSVAIQKHSAIFFNDYTGKLFTKETNEILIRFSKVFEQAYVRFLDLQKAEAQAREAQIEAALERVRSRTMGMQKSEELKEVIQVVFQQFAHLNINIEHTGFVMDYKARDDYNLWIADPLGVPSQVTIPYFDSVYYNRFNEAKEKGEDFFAINLTFEEKNKFYQKLFEYVPGLPEESKKFYFNCPGLAASTVLLENIGLYIENFSGTPYTDEENATLMRFGKVFQQTYTRFLDLQKAEAQARESQIQLALERVRARTMAMQRSDELKDAAALLFQQVKSLGVPAYSCGYNIWEKDDKEFTSWMSTQDGSIINGVPNIPLTEDANFIRYVESKQKGEPFFVLELRGERMQEHYQYLKTIPAFKVYFDYAVSVGFDLPETQIHHLANFSHGNLLFITLEPCPEYHDVFKRLGAVFEQTYTRFLDLKKAEAQAREAQIETALERVRGVAMSMMKSDELLNVCESVFKQLKYLGSADLRNAQIYINYDDKGKFLNYNYSDDAGSEIIEVFYDSHPNVYDFYKKLKESSESFADYEISGAQLDEWKYYLNNTLGQKRNEKLEHATELHYYFYSVGTGALGITTFKPIRDEELQILKRFRNVFNLSYQRYTDIALAEAQAREAKIEAGLERVRSRTLAMHSSDELAETAAVVFRQLIALGIEPNRLYIAIVKDENGNAEFWITDEDGSKVSSGFNANLNENPTFQKMFLGWTGKMKSLTIDMQGQELEEYFEYLTQIKVPFKGGLSQKRRIQSIAYFSRGFIGIASPDSQPDETTQLLERFASVFNLTYARFNDLQMAEAQTHKAQIETALEKVRARALAMQEPEELKEVAWVLRNEMGLLGVEELETCSIYIRADNSENAECWFAIKKPDDDKKMVADYFALNLTDTWVGKEMLKFYNSDATQISIVMKGEQRSEWIEYCYKNSSVFSGFYGEQIPDRTYHLYKFSNGAIGAAAPGNISEESWELLGRAASVFSLAYSRFKDLTKSRIDLQNLKDEKKRSDSLLLNILPEEIANELKQFGKSYARKHEQVTILFADIKNFSSIAENLSAQELVTQLDECFRAFDHIVDKHGLEKIKTVGDAYVCACGLPKPVADNAVKAVRAALDMMNFIKGFAITKTIQDLPAFEFRIGINTGSVITGVVGLKKFTYDIWGDAVNMAARMEQHGEAGRINISDSTYQLIKDKFACTPRGKIEAKNKGEVEMYFVEQAT